MSLENGNEKMEKDADKYLMDANKDNKPRKQRHIYNFWQLAINFEKLYKWTLLKLNHLKLRSKI